MDYSTIHACSQELLKLCAPIEELQQAYKRLGILRTGHRIGTSKGFDLSTPKAIATMMGAFNVPSARNTKKALRARLGGSGLRPSEVKALEAEAAHAAKGMEGVIGIAPGGGTHISRRPEMGMMSEMGVSRPDVTSVAKSLSPEAQKATNIVTGLHEGYERGAKTVLPMHSHLSPDVIMKEHNLVRGMTGPGTEGARELVQSMRGGQIGEGSVLGKLIEQRYGPQHAARFNFGAPESMKLTKAMRKDLNRSLKRENLVSAAEELGAGNPLIEKGVVAPGG